MRDAAQRRVNGTPIKLHRMNELCCAKHPSLFSQPCTLDSLCRRGYQHAGAGAGEALHGAAHGAARRRARCMAGSSCGRCAAPTWCQCWPVCWAAVLGAGGMHRAAHAPRPSLRYGLHPSKWYPDPPSSPALLAVPPLTGISRAMSAAIMSPVTLVKTRMEYGGPNAVTYRSTAHALTSIARAEGVGGLFRGLGPTVLTNAPFSAAYYMMYTRLKGWLTEEGRPTVAVNFVSGVAAATAATLLTQVGAKGEWW